MIVLYQGDTCPVTLKVVWGHGRAGERGLI
jgi:hypothetical protein